MNQQGKCYKCGGFLAVNDTEDAMICPFCGKPIIAEKAIRSYTGEVPAAPAGSAAPPGDSRFVVVNGALIRCNCFTETDIRIPDGIRVIGDAAFQGMNHIETVQIPAGTQVIGWGAFSGCRNLREVKLPEGIETIDRDVFSGCTSLKSIRFPDSVARIEAGAMTGCTSLETVNLPPRIESLPWRIFEGCTSLRSVRIPRQVKTIDDYAFAECTALEEIRFECLHPEPGSAAGVSRIGMNAFRGCVSLSHIQLPATLQYIGNQAFRGCEGLTGLTVPDSVKAIYPLAFADCIRLASVSLSGNTKLYKGSNPYKYGDNVATFYNCPKLLDVSYDDLQQHFWAFPAYIQSQEQVFLETGRCRHCGGTFKGMAVKICTVCHAPKDY